MTVAELKEKLKEYPDNAIVVTTTSNFEQGNSTIEASYISFYNEGSIKEQTFRDAFDGGTYTKKVVSIIGGNISLIKIS